MFDIASFTSVLVVLVVGLGVIASMMGIINLAHGEFVLLGALTAWQTQQWGVSGWIALIAAPLVVGAFGAIVEVTIVRRLYRRPLSALLATFALGALIREIVRFNIGSIPKPVRAPLGGTFEFGGQSFSQWRASVIVICVLLVAGLVVFLRTTRVGLNVRATLDNRELAESAGLPTSAIYTGTFAFGAGCAGLAGALVAPLQSLFPELGTDFLVISFLSVMVGGVGGLEGPVYGAISVGLASSGLPWIMSPVHAELVVFGLAVLAMRLRPAGLLTKGNNT